MFTTVHQVKTGFRWKLQEGLLDGVDLMFEQSTAMFPDTIKTVKTDTPRDLTTYLFNKKTRNYNSKNEMNCKINVRMYFFLIFGSWTLELLIFDLKIGILVKN